MTYAPSPWLVVALVLGGVAAGAGAFRADGPGALLLAILAVALLTEAARSALLRPTLRYDADGLTVGRERHAWSDVVAVGSLARPGNGRRLRRGAKALEIDLGDRLLVVPAYRLGAPVDEVVTALRAAAGTRSS